jgi:hypothetical protein
MNVNYQSLAVAEKERYSLSDSDIALLGRLAIGEAAAELSAFSDRKIVAVVRDLARKHRTSSGVIRELTIATGPMLLAPRAGLRD